MFPKRRPLVKYKNLRGGGLVSCSVYFYKSFTLKVPLLVSRESGSHYFIIRPSPAVIKVYENLNAVENKPTYQHEEVEVCGKIFAARILDFVTLE